MSHVDLLKNSAWQTCLLNVWATHHSLTLESIVFCRKVPNNVERNWNNIAFCLYLQSYPPWNCRSYHWRFLKCPEIIHSTQGSRKTASMWPRDKFCGSNDELAKGVLGRVQVTIFPAENLCDFLMNVLEASHNGGMWECQIRTIRSVMFCFGISYWKIRLCHAKNLFIWGSVSCEQSSTCWKLMNVFG